MDDEERLGQRIRSGLRPSLDFVVEQLARSRLASQCASFLRNRMDAVVALHLGLDINHETNGEAWIARQLGPRCHTFVDVGANRGDWTDVFLAVSPDAVGILFEPGSRASAELSRRFGANPRVTIVAAAASDVEGTAEFFEEPDAGRHSSLVAGFSRGAEATSVRTTTLDAELAARGIDRVDYLKIDAEGHDLKVLRGAEQYLREQKVGFVQFEYNEAWRLAANRLQDALELLHGAGYEVFLLKGSGLWSFPYSIYGEYYRYSNFVAIRRTQLDDLASLVRGRA